MDARRTRARRVEVAGQQQPVPPAPAGRGDFATVLAKLDAVLDAVLAEQHELRRLVHKIAVPIQTVSLTEAAARLCRSTKWLKRVQARAVFTDGRPPDRRVAGADLVFFADEIEVYRLEGEPGVRRLRAEMGR